MKLKSGVTVLAVLCVVLATPAHAAKITINDQGGWIDPQVLIQTWVRINENGSADHTGPSYDIFFRRMRFYINGQVNDHFGVIADTDVSYTQTGAAAGDVITNPVTQQNAVRFNSPTIVMNEALGYINVCKEFKFWAGLQLLPWVHESLTDISRFAALDEQTDVTERGRPSGYYGRDRDLGIVFTGDLAFINYRIGVFNGVQTIAGKSTVTASGLVTGPTNVAVNYPAYTGVNPGDSPSYDGAIRINIIGIEPGYGYAGGLAYDGKAYMSVGGGVNFQPRAIAATARGLSTASYEGYFADLHVDIPFADNEFVVEAGWVRTVYSGNGAPVSSANATGLGLINNAGDGYYGSAGVRFGWIYPYFAMEYYVSNLSGDFVQSTYQAFGNGWLPASGRVGTLQTYHGGLKIMPGGPVGNMPLIDLDMAFQSKQNAGVATVSSEGVPTNGNQWSGTIEFEWKI
ncbi:MAG: hypothetical protein ACLQIH_09275 [Myxococcaceae bacterium]